MNGATHIQDQHSRQIAYEPMLPAVRVLNLYSGIGGNRKLWTNAEITAVEFREDIADVYKHYFPNDTVIVGDAHQYLLDHYKEFRSFVKKKTEKGLHITKDAGIFICNY